MARYRRPRASRTGACGQCQTRKTASVSTGPARPSSVSSTPPPPPLNSSRRLTRPPSPPCRTAISRLAELPPGKQQQYVGYQHLALALCGFLGCRSSACPSSLLLASWCCECLQTGPIADVHTSHSY